MVVAGLALDVPNLLWGYDLLFFNQHLKALRNACIEQLCHAWRDGDGAVVSGVFFAPALVEGDYCGGCEPLWCDALGPYAVQQRVH